MRHHKNTMDTIGLIAGLVALITASFYLLEQSGVIRTSLRFATQDYLTFFAGLSVFCGILLLLQSVLSR